jgi:hypothetical protein
VATDGAEESEPWGELSALQEDMGGSRRLASIMSRLPPNESSSCCFRTGTYLDSYVNWYEDWTS